MDIDRPNSSCPNTASSSALVVYAPPPRPLNPSPVPAAEPSLSSSTAGSIDEELARAATASLSMGPATVDGPWYNFALPKKLHMGLYSSTLGDATMSANSGNDNGSGGVPGFPDFPDFWLGESSAKEGNGNSKKSTKQAHTTKKQAPRRRASPSADAAIDDELCKKVSSLFAHAKARGKDRTISNSKRRQRRIVRKAVNVPYGSSSHTCTGTKANPCGLGAGKELKRRLRDQRRLKRIEMVVKLQEKRRRKREMGDICRSMASISCN